MTIGCRSAALGRAFANLIDDAVKYGGEADVRLNDSADEVVIRIADRGKVFASFYRLEASRSRDTGGTGLGLALARNIVRGHGSDITLEDREGGGLVACVGLPRSEPK